MRALLLSTYELGHQPLHVAAPAAALRRAGHEVSCRDLSVERLDRAALDGVDCVCLSVPMHTAMRLAMEAASAIKAARPELHICFYGLYAPVSRDLTLGSVADRVIGGEYQDALVAWVNGLADSGRASSSEPAEIYLKRSSSVLPARELLPPLESYARLAIGDERRLVGYVEASHGCVYRCRHCPVPAVYDGTVRMVPRADVLADVEQLVAMGARHITFGDPDFLNGWNHSLRLVRAMHERYSFLTFDVTTKVEHVLRHRKLWPELRDLGCLFVVCALESTNDEILERLDKGHTTQQASEAIGVLRASGIEVRPSFVPFTPWTTVDDVLDILDFVAAHDMVENVDPVQYSIRLLLPEGSLLLDHPDLGPYLGSYDPNRLSYLWSARDPRVDALQQRVAALVADATKNSRPSAEIFDRVRLTTLEAAAGRSPRASNLQAPATRSSEDRPRLTEPWFC